MSRLGLLLWCVRVPRQRLDGQRRGRLTTVKNHGVPLDVVDATFEQSRTFFKAPVEVKRAVSAAGTSRLRGG